MLNPFVQDGCQDVRLRLSHYSQMTIALESMSEKLSGDVKSRSKVFIRHFQEFELLLELEIRS